jgi:hypothetical protein
MLGDGHALRGVLRRGCGCGYVSISSAYIFNDGKMRLLEQGMKCAFPTCQKESRY